MKLPTDLSGRELRRALERIGFVYLVMRRKWNCGVIQRRKPRAAVVSIADA
jgi:hypothetical protein